MNSRILFENQHYVACVVAKGTLLTIQNKHTNKGKMLDANHAQFSEWLEAFTTETDKGILNAFCKSFFN